MPCSDRVEELLDGGTTSIAPFDEGERVLYSVTGDWATVIEGGAVETAVMVDGYGYEMWLPNGTLIPADDVDPDPYDEEPAL